MKTLSTCLAVSALTLLSVNAFAASTGNPADLTTTASITVMNPITITAGPGMAFAPTPAPNSGSTTVSSTTAGGFSLAGQASTAYTFVAAAGSCSDAGLSLHTLSVAGSTGFDGTGAGANSVSGDITIGAGTSSANHTCDYTVTADY